MNERIEELAAKTNAWCIENHLFYPSVWQAKFAELIVQECSNLLWQESERLQSYAINNFQNYRDSANAELLAEKCLEFISMFEKHFGVE